MFIQLHNSPSCTRLLASRTPRHFKSHHRSRFSRHSSSSTYREPLDTSDWKATGSSRISAASIVLAFIPIFTFGLGTWQVKRLYWKRGLINDLTDKMSKQPIELPRNVNAEAIPEFAYRKVLIRGHFDHDGEILIEPRTREGELGYHVITPLIRSDGGRPVLVNRGFIRRDKRSMESRPHELGEVEVVGMLRAPEQPTAFTPKNNPSKGQWHFVDVVEIAKVLGTDPILIDAITYANGGVIGQMLSNGQPVGRGGTIQLRNQHASYVVTWYGLSLVTSVLAWRLLRRPLSGAHRFAGVK